MVKICPRCKEVFNTSHGKRDRFCSRICFGLFHKGEKRHPHSEKTKEKIRKARKLQSPPRPKGTIFTEEHKAKLRKPDHLKVKSRGYTLLYTTQHPFRSRHNRFPVHRLVVEKVIGRYLRRSEIVHHINQVKTDNRPSNLYVCSRSEHIVIHKSKPYIKVKSNLKYFQTSLLVESGN